MISSVVGPRRSSKVLPKAKLTPQKGHGHCLVVYSQCDPLQLSESQWKLFIWKVCSANWWDAPNTATLQLTLVNRKGPVLLHDNIQVHIAQPGPQKLNELSCEVLPHLPYSLALSPAHGQRSLAGYSPWDHKEPDTTEELSLHFTHQQTTTSSSISTTFLQGKYFHNQQNTENAFQEFVESQSRDF